MRFILPAIVVITLCGANGLEESEALLSRLEKSFSSIKTVQASVKQVKNLAVFDRKMVLTGRVYIENPDRLAWHIEKPVRYSIVIDGDNMKQWDEESGSVQKFSIVGNPVFGIVSEQLKKWFSGRYTELRKEYEVSVVTEKPALTLKFVPRPETATAGVMKEVSVRLAEDERYISEIRIEDGTGGLTTIVFSDTVLNKPVPPDAWEVGNGE